MVIKMATELRARCYINILNIEHNQDYDIFMHDDLYDKLYGYIETITDNQKIIEEYHKLIKNNKNNIKKLTGKSFNQEAYLILTEELRSFKRTYLISR